MCFVKSSSPKVVEEPEVIRKQADASLTKNSINTNANRGYQQNVRPTAYG